MKPKNAAAAEEEGGKQAGGGATMSARPAATADLPAAQTARGRLPLRRPRRAGSGALRWKFKAPARAPRRAAKRGCPLLPPCTASPRVRARRRRPATHPSWGTGPKTAGGGPSCSVGVGVPSTSTCGAAERGRRRRPPGRGWGASSKFYPTALPQDLAAAAPAARHFCRPRCCVRPPSLSVTPRVRARTSVRAPHAPPGDLHSQAANRRT
jgi:hypothetical protein